jgi:uncharacterized repeat protein (TIGR01451 family)
VKRTTRGSAGLGDRIRRLLATVLSVGLIAGGLSAVALVSDPGSRAEATPGTPGTPQTSTVVYAEDFENGAGTTPVLLTNYTGATGQKYTADNGWLTGCNGNIVSLNVPYTQLGTCGSTTSSANIRQLAYALGVHTGSANPNANNAVGAYTDNNPGANAIEFQTVTNVPLASANGRFLTFSADTAAVNCSVSAPQYQFSFLDDAGTATNVGGVINACSSAQTVAVPAVGPQGAQTARVGTYTSNGSLLFNGSSLGIRMRNANGSGTGNDAAFDNIRILDVTPQLDKAFSPVSATTGGVSTLTFTVTNTSELAAKNGWSFTDALPAGLTVATPSAAATTCPAGAVTAAPGATSITATGDLAAGMAACTISVNVTSPTPGDYTNGPGNVTATGLNPPADATVTFSKPSIGLVKHAGASVDVNGNGITDAGDTIAYTFTVTNTGDVPLAAVAVSDAKAGAVTCPAAPVAPGASVVCAADAPYTITAADQAAGSVDNTATASGTPPVGGPVTSAPSTTRTPTVAPAPALSIVKSASPSAAASYAVGTPITYSFVVTNTGNVPVQGVAIDDSDFSGTGTLSAIVCPATTLGAGASTTCTATYELTQADVDAGQLTNAATATGTPVGGGDPVTTPPSQVTIPNDPAPAVTLVKSASPASVSRAGDVITYSFLVTNTGNVSLTNPTVDETAFSGTGTTPAVVCPTGVSLLPGQAATCTAQYTVTQEDIDAGAITNTATASATPPGGATAPVSDPSSAAVPVVGAPALTVVKSSQLTGAAVAGGTVTYSFLVANTGNVTVGDVVVTDTDFSGTGPLGAITCPVTTLAPGASTTCTAGYTLTQADVDAGTLTNSATAGGTTPGGDPVTSPPSENAQPLAAAPALALVKSADPVVVTAAGQTVAYAFLVTNTGNVTLTDPTVAETAFSGTGTAPAAECPTGPLAPGASVTCTATYTVTQADVDSGSLTNTASASATPPGDTPAPVSDPSSATVSATPAPGLSIVKSSRLDGTAAAGQPVTYSFLVTNTGNVTVSGIAVTDTDFSGTGDLSAIECPSTALAPGADVTCSASYTLTQADVDAGELTNTATAGGTTPGGDPVTSTPSTNEQPLDPAPALSIVKSAAPAAPADFNAGEKITYSFVLTNTGNVTLTDVNVTEGDFSGTGALPAPTCPEGAASLAPGAQVVCTTVYTVTQEDIDAGSITNTATGTGTPPGTETPIGSAPSTVTVPEPAKPGVTVVKTADVQTVTRVGQVVRYSFTVTNTGNTTLSDPKVHEGAFSGAGTLGAIVCPAGSNTLVPGQIVICAAEYTVVAADLTGKPLTNTATVSATPPGGAPITSDPSTAKVTLPNPPAPQPLASTGSTIGWAAGIGGAGALALLAAGAALLIIRRRRPSES